MDDPAGNSLLSSLLVMALLTLLNAFLAGAEMAFVSLNPAKIKDLADRGDRRAKRVERLLRDSDSFLSAIQVGITVGGFFNSASAAQAFVNLILPAFGRTAWAQTAATFVVTLGISYVTLVLGELYPKQVALQVPEKYALLASRPIAVIKILFSPFIRLLTISTYILKKLTPIDFSKKEEKLTRQEMKALLNSSRNDGAIDLDEFNMMKGVLSLDSRLVTEVMVPRVDAVMLDVNDDQQKNLNKILKQTHSRIPLYDDDKDNIVGVLHLKDVLLKRDALRSGRLTLKDVARPALFIPETLTTDELLVKFRNARTQLALIVDEFGGLEGLVTLDDLIVEIVGNIADEYGDNTEEFRKVGENAYVMRGSVALSDLNRMFDCNIRSEDADTVAGWMIEQLGFIPKAKARHEVRFDNMTFRAVKASQTRVEMIRLTIDEPEETPEETDARA